MTEPDYPELIGALVLTNGLAILALAYTLLHWLHERRRAKLEAESAQHWRSLAELRGKLYDRLASREFEQLEGGLRTRKAAPGEFRAGLLAELRSAAEEQGIDPDLADRAMDEYYTGD